MRAAGLSTIQQTLTPEAATVLNQSISEAARCSHGQTTPLHVAATLLASPSGFLRQACIKSHPNSSHPLQCRALELCFSVALERLPANAAAATVTEPPISNALMAALKRAQAHQRRGCPEQQQQPLLAVKVELEQLVISILDDPSVSRVMREASFSSPAVKATIEQSLSSVNGFNGNSVVNSAPVGLGFRPSASAVNRNMYLNPRLQQQKPSSGFVQSGRIQHRGDEVNRVVEILLRSKKRNPVLVGESEPEAVIKELLRRIKCKESCDGVFRNVEVVRFGTDVVSGISAKINELGGLVEEKIGSGGVLIDLGDLKWLVEQQPGSFGGLSSGGVSQQVVSEIGRVAVADMAKLLARFEDRCSGSGRVWLIGTATCETYLRCQVYHPTMENDWDLQAVPIASKSPLPGMFPRLGTNGILSTSIESLSPLKGFPAAPAALSRTISESLDRTRKFNCCPECMQNYEQELAILVSKESEIKSESTQLSLPLWLQNAKAQDNEFKTANQTQTKDQDMIMKQRTEELQKKWKEACFRSHPNFHQLNCGSERILPTPLTGKSFYNPLLLRQPSQPRPQGNRNLGDIMQLNPKLQTIQPVLEAASPPGSPVRTELALGTTKVSGTTPENPSKEQTRDFLGGLSAEQQDRFKELQNEKLLSMLDADNFKRLLKGLVEKVWWQKEAASAVATTVSQCKMGNGKRKGKGDIWLFFTGPDRVGKKEMASALAELVNGANPIAVSLGSQRNNGQAGTDFRGKTVLDKIVEAVRRNPFSVIMLEDIDEADMILRGNIKRAMERGHLADSYGREISLGNVIFIVTANWCPDKVSRSSDSLDDEKLASLGSSGLQLRLSLRAKTSKRQGNWLHDEQRYKKSKNELSLALSLDLNEAVDFEEDGADGSRNSSDLTNDNKVEHSPENRTSPIASSVCAELLKIVDDSILFKPVELRTIRQDVASSITKRFSTIMCNEVPIEIPEKVLEKVLAGLWLDRTSLEGWTEKVLVPCFRQLKSFMLSSNGAPHDESMIVQLEIDNDSERQGPGEWLPSCIKVETNGL